MERSQQVIRRQPMYFAPRFKEVFTVEDENDVEEDEQQHNE